VYAIGRRRDKAEGFVSSDRFGEQFEGAKTGLLSKLSQIDSFNATKVKDSRLAGCFAYIRSFSFNNRPLAAFNDIEIRTDITDICSTYSLPIRCGGGAYTYPRPICPICEIVPAFKAAAGKV
jgi:hypothetical protein